MNCFPLPWVAAFVLVALPHSGMAQSYYEPFSGEVGEDPPTGWEMVAGVASAATTDSGSLEYTGLKQPEGNMVVVTANSVETSAVSIAGAPIVGLNGGTFYYSLLLEVESLGKMQAEAGHTGLIMISDHAAGKAIGGKAQAAIGVVPDGSGGFKLSISSGHQGPRQGATVAEESLELGTSVFVVVAFERSGSSGTARMWINPKPGQPEPESVTVAKPDPQLSKNIDAVFIGGQTSLLSIPGRFKIDEIRVGSTWEEVTPAN